MKGKKKTFTAIDFETAQGYRWSICQVGIARYEEGMLEKTLELLVQPPGNYYWWKHTGIHGISARDTEDAPTFEQLWPRIEPFIKGQEVVAHNGFGFDFPCLKQTLEYYKMSVPEFSKHCTYRLYGSNLKALCSKHNIALRHHNALSDAVACGELFLRWGE